MAVTMEEYLKALKDINFALTGGLETAIAVLENFEKLTQTASVHDRTIERVGRSEP